jgi:hypothetical protein
MPFARLAQARRRCAERVPEAIEPPFLPLQTGQNLALPALLDPLDPHWRDVNGHPVFEPRTEQRVDVRMRRPAVAAVLMDREDTLESAGGTPESLVDRVSQNAFAEVPIEPRETLRGRVVDGHDEA